MFGKMRCEYTARGHLYSPTCNRNLPYFDNFHFTKNDRMEAKDGKQKGNGKEIFQTKLGIFQIIVMNMINTKIPKRVLYP